MTQTRSFSEKRVLITGANGFMGSRLTEQLASEGAAVAAMVSPMSACENIKALPYTINIVRGDVRVRDDIQKIIQEVQPQIIYHLVTYGNHPQHYTGPAEEELIRIVEINMMGTANLLAACQNLDFECFINTSSAIGEYGPGTKPMTESQSPKPCTYYGASKAGATYLCNAYGKIYKKKIITLRPLYVYGPGEGMFRFVPTLIEKAMSGEKMPLTSPKDTKSFVFIDDVLEAYRLAYLRDYEGTPAINIGAPKAEPLGRVIQIVEERLGKKIDFDEGAYKQVKWQSACWDSDISLAKSLLGWEPKVDLKTGVEKSIDWVLKRTKAWA